ncbi:hypothetical protein ACPA9J_18930 [Pseudomonas aeruginosa]
MRRASSCGCWRCSSGAAASPQRQGEIRIGVPSAQPPAPGASRGWSASSSTPWILRGTPRGAPAVRRVARRGSRGDLGAQANQDLLFDQVLAACGQGGQLFQVLFNHQQGDLSALRRLPGLLADEPWHSREAKFDLQPQSEEDAAVA